MIQQDTPTNKNMFIFVSVGVLSYHSVTLVNLSFPRETVNKSSFPRTKRCSVTTANSCQS